jgi:hypothetical protein
MFMGLRGAFYLFLAVLLACGATEAQDLPASASHDFWDTTNKTLFMSHAAIESLDFGITHYNLSHGGREMNPEAKALCESGTPGQLVFFGGRTAGVVAITYLFHRTGHHTLERLFPLYASGDSAYGVVYSFAHR